MFYFLAFVLHCPHHPNHELRLLGMVDIGELDRFTHPEVLPRDNGTELLAEAPVEFTAGAAHHP